MLHQPIEHRQFGPTRHQILPRPPCFLPPAPFLPYKSPLGWKPALPPFFFAITSPFLFVGVILSAKTTRLLPTLDSGSGRLREHHSFPGQGVAYFLPRLRPFFPPCFLRFIT